MKKLLLTFLTTITFINFFAQVPNVGGIAFVGFQNSAPDGFAFVTLEDLPANTSISFTDNGWDGTALWANEQTLVWTSPSNVLLAGAIVYIADDNIANGLSLLTGPGSVVGELPNLSSAGEQILAYTGADSSPSFIAAISNSSFETICVTGTPNTNITCLPSPLVLGESAQAPINLGDIIPNLFFNLDGFNGTASQIHDAIFNSANWTSSVDIAIAGNTVWPAWNFTFTGQTPSVVTLEQSEITLTEGAPYQEIQLNFNPATSSIQTLNLLLTGMLTSADLTSTPTFSGASIPVTIPAGAISFIVQIAANEDGITEGQETGALNINNISAGLSIGSESQTLLIVNDLNNASTIQFSIESMQIPEGNSYSVIVHLEPAASQSGSFDVHLSEGAGLTSADYSCSPSPSGGIITIAFAAGLTDTTIAISTVDDLSIEGNETLTMSIENPSAGFIAGFQDAFDLIIQDNDTPIPPTNSIFINEVMSSNSATISSPDGMFSDWIELYNASLNSIDLAGKYISDDENNLSKYQFPTGSLETIMPAGSYKLVWADDSVELGALHTNFKISAAGEKIILSESAGTIQIIDSVSVPALTTDQSWGRQINGGAPWILFDQGMTTPNVSNELSAIVSTELDQFELFPNPASEYISIRQRSFSNQNQDVRIDLFSIDGKNVKSMSFKNANSIMTFPLDSFTPGIYQLRIQSQQGTAFKKFVFVGK